MNLQRLTISAEQFVNGYSFSDNISVSGLSPAQKGINLFKDEGTVLHPQPSATDITGLTDEAIAMIPDPLFGGVQAIILDDSGAFYTLDGTTLTKKQTDATNAYTYGNSFLVEFKGNIYATSGTDIAQLSSTLSTLDHDWWTVTEGETALNGSYRHDMVVVEDTLFIADGYYLHTWDGTTSTYNAMTLPTTINITALHKHPDGRSLIAFASDTLNASHTKKVRAYMYIIDTNTLEFTREITFDDQVEGAIMVGGRIFLTSGDKFGYLNGDTFKLLRKINIDQEAVYKPKLANFDGVVMCVDDDSIFAFGDVNGLGDVPFYPYVNNENSNYIRSICALGSKELLVSYGSNKLKKLDYDNTDGATKVRTGLVRFGAEVIVRKIVPVLDSAMSSGTDIEFSLFDEKGDETVIGAMEQANYGTIKERAFFCNIWTRQLSLEIDFQAVPKGVKEITIYYESGE